MKSDPPSISVDLGTHESRTRTLPVIPDHELIRRIGCGSYGDVWLTRNAVGTWRAVKVVYRDRFHDSRPYDREFSGLKKFEPISRSNEAFVDILQMGKNDEAGCFYYVMELADPANALSSESSGVSGQGEVDPATYTPRTLAQVLDERGRLPLDTCLDLGLSLNLGLTYLHRSGLIHRDIKPSNIIFVDGIPKLADIGLVVEMAEAHSFVGTEGYMPPEGPNSAQADLYSLGKVLYEAGMGKDRKDFPEPLSQLADLSDATHWLEFNAILLKACAASQSERYISAEAMNADLALVRSGGSVRQQQRLTRRFRLIQRLGAVLTAMAMVVGAGWWWQAAQTARERDLAQAAAQNAARAERNESLARESLYAADIQLAQQALQTYNLRLARALLQNHVPAPDQPDLRGFEWRLLWQHCRSAELFTLPGNPRGALTLAVDADGRRLAVGGFYGGFIRVFDLESRQQIALIDEPHRILSLTFLPGQNVLVSASPDDVRCWDLETFEQIQRLPEAGAPAVASPDGRYLITGNGPWNSAPWNQPKELKVWDTRTWTLIRSATFPVTGGYSLARNLYLQVAFGTDPSQMAVTTGDRVRLFTCPDLEEVFELPDRLPYSYVSRPFLALSPDNRTLAIPSPSGFGIRLWDLEANRERLQLHGHTDHVFDLRFSADGRMLATGSPDQTVKLWNMETGKLIQTFGGQADEVINIAFSPDDATLYSLGISDGVVMAWNVHARPPETLLRRPIRPQGFDPAGGMVVLFEDRGHAGVLDPASLEVEPLAVPRWNPDHLPGNWLDSVSSDGRYHHIWLRNERRLEVWDRIEERKLCSLPDLFPGGSYDLGRSRILTYHTNVAGDRVLAAWQLPGGERVWEQEDGGGICYGVSCTPNGDYVLITQEWSMEVFRVDDYGAHRTLELPKGIFVRAVLSPDGRSFATGTADITLRNVATGEVEGVLRGHTRKNTRFAFSPDGRTLASMADDRTIRLWHLPTRREMLRFGMGNEIQGGLGLEFSPDGRVLAAYWEDDQGPVTRLFFAPSFAEIAVAEGADPSPIAGRDPVAWMAVAGELRRLGRLDDARAAYARALDLVRGDPAKVWLHSRIREMEATLQVSM